MMNTPLDYMFDKIYDGVYICDQCKQNSKDVEPFPPALHCIKCTLDVCLNVQTTQTPISEGFFAFLIRFDLFLTFDFH